MKELSYCINELKKINEEITNLIEKNDKEEEKNYALRLKLSYIKNLNAYIEDDKTLSKFANLDNEYFLQLMKKNRRRDKNEAVCYASIIASLFALASNLSPLASPIALTLASFAYSFDYAIDHFDDANTLLWSIKNNAYEGLEKRLEKYNGKKFKLIKQQRKQIIKNNNAKKQSVSKETLIQFLNERYKESSNNMQLYTKKLNCLLIKKRAFEIVINERKPQSNVKIKTLKNKITIK